MKQYPPIPRLSDAPPDLLEGHLWLVEKVDGAQLRFQLQEEGYLRFGDSRRVYDPEDVPEPYQHAVRYIREAFDRTALQGAVENVEDIVFFGEATHQHTIEYDWDRTPSFLGYDIWDANNEQFRPLASVKRIFERLGLCAVNVFERERPARDFDPDSYTVPDSAYYDGPAEGVIVRNKQGQRGQLHHRQFQDSAETIDIGASAEELAQRYGTDERFETIASNLEDRDWDVTVDVLYEHALEAIVRENHRTLYEGRPPVEMETFRSDVAALTRAYLDGRQ